MTPTLDERVSRLERYFYGMMTELCVMAGQIRSDVKKDEREDAERQVREAEPDAPYGIRPGPGRCCPDANYVDGKCTGCGHEETAEKGQSRVTHKQGIYIEPAKEGRTEA